MEAKTTKRETKKAHRKFGAPTVAPTEAPKILCTVSDNCEKTFFCWDGECRDTRRESVCMTYEGMPTQDGWAWDEIHADPNFKCGDADGPTDHKASRPKEKKHTKAEYVHWKGFVKWFQEDKKKDGTWAWDADLGGGRRLEFV